MRKRYILAGFTCLLLAAFCIVKALPANPTRLPAPVQAAARVVERQAIPVLSPDSPVLRTEPAPYVCPVDFDALQKVNEDIYAWLYIPGTEINYPLLQSIERGDAFYLNHNIEGKSDANGCLYTEREYNSRDLSDPVTVVYGHHMLSGHMFGELQDLYSSSDSFQRLREIILYTPEQELHYQVFAAVPYSNTHILYQYHRFTEKARMAEFLHEIATVHAFSARVDTSAEVSEDDHLLVLSTCLQQDNTRRFLVVAKLIESGT